MNDLVILTINAMDWSGWKSVRIEAGIERIARSFELSVTDQWPGSLPIRRIKPGDSCEVCIGSDLVCSGFIDATPINYDANSITMIIRGRSKTADLVDCSADNPSGQFKAMQAEDIAKKLAGQYGLNVITEAATGLPITDHQIQQGETAFESLDRIAKQRQVLLTDNAAGDVVIASPGSGGNASSSLQLGINILSASAGFDYTDVYSNYQVKGQKTGTDDSFGDQAAKSQGQATDSSLTRKRVLIVRQTGQADANTCQQRATYEQQIRQAKAGEMRYKVVGWRQADGSLWRPNQMVQISDPIMDFFGYLLISECIYTIDDSGQICELVVIPPGAFATEPETKAKAKAKKKTSAGVDDSWPD